MSRHKYFEDLEEKCWEHPSHLGIVDSKRHKKWFQERRLYGFDSRETYSLNYTFYVWLYEHLMMYKEKAIEVIDLEYHTIVFNGENLTQLECIDKMLEGCRLYIKDCESTDKEVQRKIKEVVEIWSIILPYMWW